MSDIRVALPAHDWRPRPYQENLWAELKAGRKRAVAVWHRRAGKDEVTLHHTACAMFERVGNYWHMLPEASQARKAIWDAINPHSGKRRIDEAFPKELREVTRENEMLIRMKNGSTWQVVGSDNYNSLVGSPPVGIVFSEWALSDPSSWAYLRPILRENGGWALFIYTPRGRNHGATTFEAAKDDPAEWFAEKLTAEQTGVFSKAQLDQELKEYIREFGRDDGESRFRQEYLCDFNIAVIGAYYGRQMTEAEDEGRIGKIAHNRDLKVDTWWDLGRADATSVWFVQHALNQVHVIDHFSVNGAEPADLAVMLQERREQCHYVYGEHLFPHDGGAIKQGMGGQSLADMMDALGFTIEVPPRHDIAPGIAKVRQLLARCYFDREKCARGIESLRNYHKEWNDKTRSFAPTPKHDWSSHDADAFRTGAMADHDYNEARILPRDRYSRPTSKRGGAWAV